LGRRGFGQLNANFTLLERGQLSSGFGDGGLGLQELIRTSGPVGGTAKMTSPDCLQVPSGSGLIMAFGREPVLGPFERLVS
jgi:hypothetical protein